MESYGCWGTEARQHLARLAFCLATRYNTSKSQATSNFVWETQLDPGEGKCSSSAVLSNVLSRHLLDSVLPLLVTLCLLHNNHNIISGIYVYL